MDYRLIELCRVGDSSAIENFVRTYRQDVYRLALSILDDPSEAQDRLIAFTAVINFDIYSICPDGNELALNGQSRR